MYLRPMIRYLFVFLGLCIIFSCEEPDLTGSDVLPVSDQPGLFTSDTSTITAKTVLEDSLVSSLNTYPLMLGSMNDPEVGITNASFNTQVLMGSSLTSFDSITTADSVILSFGYTEIYGDTTAVHHISVNELDTTLTNPAYTTSDFSIKNGGGLGYISLVPNLRDSVPILNTKQAPQLRLKLNTDFGSTIMQKYLSQPSLFSSNDQFLTYFKGISITDSADGAGSIISLDANSSLNALTIYFHTTDTPIVAKSYSFKINASCIRSNRFKHLYNSTVFDSVSPATVYVQSTAGLKTKVEFPYLMNLSAAQKVSINKAELVVKLRPGSEATLANHPNLFIYAPDSLGRNEIILDSYSSAGYVGGTYTNGEYKFNVFRHIQRILNGVHKNNGIYLVASGSVSNAKRTFLQGATTMKLNLTYTLQK